MREKGAEKTSARRVRIEAGAVGSFAEFNTSSTAHLIWEALPLTGRVQRWGEEVYFEIPVQAKGSPDAREEVAVGEMGYWPPGRAFCLFFGRTPASTDERPRAASPVNPLGFLEGDPRIWSRVREGTEITITRVEGPD
jgi:hypothetical protein